jgi:hypothetical protein
MSMYYVLSRVRVTIGFMTLFIDHAVVWLVVALFYKPEGPGIFSIYLMLPASL